MLCTGILTQLHNNLHLYYFLQTDTPVYKVRTLSGVFVLLYHFVIISTCNK